MIYLFKATSDHLMVRKFNGTQLFSLSDYLFLKDKSIDDNFCSALWSQWCRGSDLTHSELLPRESNHLLSFYKDSFDGLCPSDKRRVLKGENNFAFL